MTIVSDTLSRVGVRAFGIGMPLMSPSWSDPATTDAALLDAAMAMQLPAGSWLCPMGGLLRRIGSENDPRFSLGLTLIGSEGQAIKGPGWLLTTFPQAHLRLARLYAQVLETASDTRPERNRGLPFRPVPRHFFFAGAVNESEVGGQVEPGTSINLNGEMTIFDGAGMPIDPMAVLAAFSALMTAHHPLQFRPGSDSFDADHQLKALLASHVGTPAVTRVRLAHHSGKPYEADPSHLEGITAVDASRGLYTLNNVAPANGKITIQAGTGIEGTFPDEQRRLLLIGPATTGRLTDTFEPPALPNGIALERDFFSVRVVELKRFLLGVPDPDFIGTKAERQPAIRRNEPLTFLSDGNDVLAAANAALGGTPDESLSVAQAINGNFPAPEKIGAEAHWPEFPDGPSPASAGALPVNLRDQFAQKAQWFDDGNAETANVDVVLTLNGLPPGAAVRVYPRKFVADAREERGDGRGGISPASGALSLLIPDPLGLRGLSDAEIALIQNSATLHCDVMIVKRTGEARLYGNVEAEITETTTDSPPAPATNRFATAERRGVSNAGVLGLGTPIADLPDDPIDVILALSGEGTPRDAPRWPTMARRELLVAGREDEKWRAVLGGGRLAEETHSADPRRGSPGGLGGRETQFVGLATQNGRLAYDIARMAFRRTTYLGERIAALAEDRWDEPAEPPAVAIGAAPTETSGMFAGVVAQTIAPFTETPELAPLRGIIEANLNDIPGDFNGLVDWVAAKLPSGPLPNALNALKTNPALDEPKRARLFSELHREIMAAAFGRRDAQWAIEEAIAGARNLIYIESPGFAATQKNYAADPPPPPEEADTPPPYAVDLIAALKSRLAAAPGLHVIICTPKFPDFARGYEQMAAYEAADRRARISDLGDERVVAFHPIGFPGRPSRLESTVVIVDDIWALVGSSTFRRRGLTFDGGSDLILTDTALSNGVSSGLADFRRKLLLNRIGIPESHTSDFGPMPNANTVRLSDPQEAFAVVRETLRAGGLGKIDLLWSGQTPGVPPLTPQRVDLSNPEGQEFEAYLPDALAIGAAAGGFAF